MWYNSLWLWRWLPHRLSKRQSLPTTTVLFRTTFTRTIKLNLLKFVQCWQYFPEVNSKRLYRSSEREEESRCLVFTCSTKSEIRHFHVVVVLVVVLWRQRNVQKSVMHVQSCCFANLNLLLLCRTRWGRRCRCLGSLLGTFRCDDGDGNWNVKKAIGYD